MWRRAALPLWEVEGEKAIGDRPVLPMTTILASIPCSYLDLLYGSMRGYAAIAPRRAGGRGRAQEKGGGKEGEGEMELLQHTTRATPDAPALTCPSDPRAPSYTWVRVLVTESRTIARSELRNGPVRLFLSQSNGGPSKNSPLSSSPST